MITSTIKDLYGNRIGGDGMNAQELFMSIKNPSSTDPNQAHCLFMHIGEFADDPSKVNVVVERDDQQACKSMIGTAYFSVSESYGEKVAQSWFTKEAIKEAKENYRKVDGKYVSAVGEDLEELANCVTALDVNTGSADREVQIELLKDSFQAPNTAGPCLISNMEMLDGFRGVKVYKKKKLINTASSIGAHSVDKSETSIGQFSIEDSDSDGSHKTEGDNSMAAGSVMGDASIMESSADSDISNSVVADASIAPSSAPSSKMLRQSRFDQQENRHLLLLKRLREASQDGHIQPASNGPSLEDHLPSNTD